MDFLQIHDDRTMTPWEYECIIRLRTLLTKDDTYTFIRLPKYDTLVQTVNESNRMRLNWLCQHPNGVWVDTDCYLYEVYKPKGNECCFPINCENFIDLFLIHVNGNTEWMKKMFDFSLFETYVAALPVNLRKEFYGWPIDLRKKTTGFEIIPETFYMHTAQSMKKEYQRRYHGS